MMKIISSIFLTSLFFFASSRAVVFNALNDGSLDKIEHALSSLQGDETDIKAYKGTLLMTKAGLVKGPANKLELFKEGHELLEDAIDSQNANVEYRFLRLTIQEHAPKILNYNNEIEEDKALILKSYPELDKDLKNYIKDYVSHSTVLKAEDLID
ncbi:hypothetical protein LVD15_02610 [Fulvivirga maritima]|uniref:hypothetical protein n=1 Tax=Fulvivirga maritima TaxID=2904247 RepID=UPI001F40D398|nr:hypothetical protein [Fulvivirga maritima]UII27339.1 hypothetical protein LVD15_02610 [Fulvivirga maritima]